jgi:peptidyl-tRNA hydrolase
MNIIRYIVVNKDLKMSAGKAMAQTVHAVSLVSGPKDPTAYNNAKQRTVIVLEGTGEQIKNLHNYLIDRDIDCDYVIDEGTNEIPTMSITALATEAFDIEDIEKREIFSRFKLYKHGRFQR